MSKLAKTITFSFTSNAFERTKATETFTFEELEIKESLSEKELGIKLDRIHQAWIWDKLNVSGNIVIDKPETFQ
ncbi:hypothetical protein [Sporosarcina aquimarina]|uniref:hypothetical protein n=1 Tax=Sporosarcina aquimarina TaxID=114975 RepID=UPI00295EB9F7|nr:hypothetical protein [Sporosarcina aquimarina]